MTRINPRARIAPCHVCGYRGMVRQMTKRDGRWVCRKIPDCTERVMNPPPEPWRYEYRMSGHIRVMPDFSGFDGAIKGAFQQVSSSLEDAALRMGSLSKTMQGVADAFANMPEINVEGFKPLGYLSENGIE